MALKAVIRAAYLVTRENSFNTLDKLSYMDDLNKAECLINIFNDGKASKGNQRLATTGEIICPTVP